MIRITVSETHKLINLIKKKKEAARPKIIKRWCPV
jgi:hypothetical protein